MKLEFLPGGSEDCPLVRLYDFTAAEVDRLFAMVSAIATGESIAIHNMPEVDGVGECRLFLRSGSKDRGLLQLSNPAQFECILTSGSWDNTAALIEPFVHGSGGYQWLVTTGDANLLLSSDGLW